jgi:hypothetical protein
MTSVHPACCSAFAYAELIGAALRRNQTMDVDFRALAEVNALVLVVSLRLFSSRRPLVLRKISDSQLVAQFFGFRSEPCARRNRPLSGLALLERHFRAPSGGQTRRVCPRRSIS